MKRIICLGLALVMLLSLSSFAVAAPSHQGHRDNRDNRDNHQRLERQHRPGDNDRAPLRWKEHRRTFDGHHLSAIHDQKLEHRYPGLRGYRWRGHGDNRQGFWHNGRYVDDGIAFFDRDDRMAGFAYLAGGALTFVDENGFREDRNDFLLIMLLMMLLRD